MRIGIVGGGLSGLALSCFLHKTKHQCVILEAGDRVGGLCRTQQSAGYRYDLGGHILFSKNPWFRHFVWQRLGDELRGRRRDNRIRLSRDLETKYPLENDLASLPPPQRYACLSGFVKAANSTPPWASNLDQWFDHTFGPALSRLYLTPYTEKVFKCPAAKLSTAWADRIPQPPVEDVLQSACGLTTEGYRHQLNFHVPAKGIEQLCEALTLHRVAIRCGCRATAVRQDTATKQWEVQYWQDGRQRRERFDKVVVACPLPELAPFGVPLADAAIRELRYRSLRVVLLGMRDKQWSQHSATYIPDPDVLPHRLCYPGYFSDDMVPADHSSIAAEITTIPDSMTDRLPGAEFISRVIASLEPVLPKFSRSDVVAAHTTAVKYAYPLYDLSWRDAITAAKTSLRQHGIELLGRFGEWEYLNMDDCLLRAVELAERLDQETA